MTAKIVTAKHKFTRCMPSPVVMICNKHRLIAGIDYGGIFATCPSNKAGWPAFVTQVAKNYPLWRVRSRQEKTTRRRVIIHVKKHGGGTRETFL